MMDKYPLREGRVGLLYTYCKLLHATEPGDKLQRDWALGSIAHVTIYIVLKYRSYLRIK